MMSILQLDLLQVLTSCCNALDQVRLNKSVLTLSREVKNLDTEQIEKLCQGKLFKSLYDTVAQINTTQIQEKMRKMDPLVANEVHFSYKQLRQEHTIVMVFLPRGSHFQLHNHPNMIVLTKPLYGFLEIDTMDLERTDKPQQKHQKCNKLTGECCCSSESKILSVVNWQRRTLTQKDVSVTTPHHNNIHSIKALTDSIFIDILIPDYKSSNPETYEYVPETEFGKKIKLLKESHDPNRYIQLHIRPPVYNV